LTKTRLWLETLPVELAESKFISAQYFPVRPWFAGFRVRISPKSLFSSFYLFPVAGKLQLSEEKKRLVQHLAHTLEPEPSDSEDDGFPLR